MALALGTNLGRYDARYAPTLEGMVPGTHLPGEHDAKYAPTLQGMMSGSQLLLGAWCQVLTYSWRHDAKYAPTRRAQ